MVVVVDVHVSVEDGGLISILVDVVLGEQVLLSDVRLERIRCHLLVGRLDVVVQFRKAQSAHLEIHAAELDDILYLYRIRRGLCVEFLKCFIRGLGFSQHQPHCRLHLDIVLLILVHRLRRRTVQFILELV